MLQVGTGCIACVTAQWSCVTFVLKHRLSTAGAWILAQFEYASAWPPADSMLVIPASADHAQHG